MTGGTGFIGGHLVERLCGDGIHVRVAARTPGKCANVARFPVELVGTDLLDANSVRNAVSNSRVVYHLAFGTDGKDPARITIEGTKNVVEAAIAAGAECVVVLSTMYVFGFPDQGKPVDESFPYRPYGGVYAQSKAAMERWCLARSQSSLPTRIVVINPTCVFGPGGGAYTTLPVDLARRGQFCWIDGGTGKCNFNYVKNLVDAMQASTQVHAAHGNRFIINDGAVTWRELFGPMIEPFVKRPLPSFTPAELKELPRHGPPFSIGDLFKASLTASEVRNAAKRSRTLRSLASIARTMFAREPEGNLSSAPMLDPACEPSFPPEWLADLYLSRNTVFSAEKASRILNWRPVIDLPTALRETIDWLIESREAPHNGGQV